MFWRMGEFSRQIKRRLRRTRGCGVELGVFGPTKGVEADGKGRFFYSKDKHYFEVQII